MSNGLEYMTENLLRKEERIKRKQTRRFGVQYTQSNIQLIEVPNRKENAS